MLSKQESIRFTKNFYDEVNLKSKLNSGLSKGKSFPALAHALLKSMEAQVARKELTNETTH
jgi:hypothetical protein